jgi:hypothetical protein
MNSLGRIDLQPPEDIEIGTRQLDVQQDALRALFASGLGAPTSPENYKGEIPANLTQLDDLHLGDLLSKLSAWCGFVDFEYAKALSARNEARARSEFIQARIRLMIKADPEQKKLTGPDKDNIVTTDPRTITAEQKVLYCEAIYEYTKVLREMAQRNWDTVSRRITQRGQEIDRMRRETNIGNAPMSGRAFRR